MFMLNSNEPIKVAHFQKLANHSMLNGALVNISFSESQINFGCLIKRGTFQSKKNGGMGSEKYILLDFAKHPSFSEVQKNSKVVNVSIRFQEEGNLF